MVGFSLSVTVTVCVALVELPLISVMVQVIVVVPTGKESGALFVTGFTPQLSAVDALPNTTWVATQVPASVLITKFEGATRMGF